MQEIHDRLLTISDNAANALQRLNVETVKNDINTLGTELARPEAWQDSTAAQLKSKQLAKLKSKIEPWQTLQKQAAEYAELAELKDATMANEIQLKTEELQADYDTLKQQLQLSGQFDDHDAILRLSAGAGGTDAQDWTEMLVRMYTRWAEKAGMKTELIEQSSGEEAGIKSAVLSVSGSYAYGKLQSEHGVHRLVRLSPFNSDNLRQTSFALLEVMPQIDTPDEIAIDEKDLKIDVYRSGGSGGQSVNTTDSAVRVTHVPTGIVIAIQNERSQLQNRETAMTILRSKLAQLQAEQHQDDLAKIKGPTQEAAWGNQIRNYVLHPYTLVKDTRTKHEERDASSVLDGKLDPFIEAYLNSSHR